MVAVHGMRVASGRSDQNHHPSMGPKGTTREGPKEQNQHRTIKESPPPTTPTHPPNYSPKGCSSLNLERIFCVVKWNYHGMRKYGNYGNMEWSERSEEKERKASFLVVRQSRDDKGPVRWSVGRADSQLYSTTTSPRNPAQNMDL